MTTPSRNTYSVTAFAILMSQLQTDEHNLWSFLPNAVGGLSVVLIGSYIGMLLGWF